MESLADDRRLGARQLQLGVVEQRLARSDRALAGSRRNAAFAPADQGRIRAQGAAGNFARSIGLSRAIDRRPISARLDAAWREHASCGRRRRRSRWRSKCSAVARASNCFWRCGWRWSASTPAAARRCRLVLDDVLVNFDDGRSGRAAEVLRDFGAAGHQLLVFTCHERLAERIRIARGGGPTFAAKYRAGPDRGADRRSASNA